MNEYEVRLKSISEDILNYRYSNGRASISIIFSVLSILLARKKLTTEDVEVIVNIEKKNVEKLLHDFYVNNFGSENFQIKSEVELELVKKFCLDYIDGFKDMVFKSAEEIGFSRKKKQIKE
ncbi:MAG: hypothetical protein QXO70_03760 [Candidatus Pacearchaeota archaeon]